MTLGKSRILFIYENLFKTFGFIYVTGMSLVRALSWPWHQFLWRRLKTGRRTKRHFFSIFGFLTNEMENLEDVCFGHVTSPSATCIIIINADVAPWDLSEAICQNIIYKKPIVFNGLSSKS